ncbi:MAG: alpha/beta fold hydrolase BchO [Polyangia bacterium]
MSFLLARPDWRTDGHDWPHREHSRFVQRGGVRWHVQILGHGPQLLLVHGTGASAHSFHRLMPLLAERFTLVVPDLPGHGFSVPAPVFDPSLPGMAAALRELLDELSLQPQAAIGHSAGAAVIARMALDRALAPRLLVGLAAAMVPPRGLGASWLSPAARLLSTSEIAAQVIAMRARDAQSVDRLVRSTGSLLDARSIELYQRLARRPGHVAAVLAMLARWDLAPLFAALPRLEVPFLLLAGAEDLAIPIAQQHELAARLPRAQLVEVAAAGHLLHEERPELTARLILAELDRLAPDADTP